MSGKSRRASQLTSDYAATLSGPHYYSLKLVVAMLPTLLYLLYRYLRKRSFHKLTTKLFNRRNQVVFVFVIMILLFSCVLFAQQTITYKVMRNGDEAGWIKLTKTSKGNYTIINMASEIRVRMLFLFTVISNEYAEFRHDTMIHSYVFRKMNGSVKTNKHTRILGGLYEVENGTAKQRLPLPPITFHTLNLYFSEPNGIEKVYADNQQQYVPIRKQSDGLYKVELPGGNNNLYQYDNGLCTKVKIDHGLYSAEFILSH